MTEAKDASERAMFKTVVEKLAWPTDKTPEYIGREKIYECIKKLWFYPNYKKWTNRSDATHDEMDEAWTKERFINIAATSSKPSVLVCPNSNRQPNPCPGTEDDFDYNKPADEWTCRKCGTSWQSQTFVSQWNPNQNLGGLDNGVYYTNFDVKNAAARRVTDALNEINNRVNRQAQDFVDNREADQEAIRYAELVKRLEPLLDRVFQGTGNQLPDKIIITVHNTLIEVLNVLVTLGKKKPSGTPRWALVRRIVHIISQRLGFRSVGIDALKDEPFDTITRKHQDKADELLETISRRFESLEFLSVARYPANKATAKCDFPLDSWQRAVISTVERHLDYIEDDKKRRVTSIAYFLVKKRPQEGFLLLGPKNSVSTIQDFCKDIVGKTLAAEVKKAVTHYQKNPRKKAELDKTLSQARETSPPKSPPKKLSLIHI